MISVQSSIRAEVSRGASPAPKGAESSAEAFSAYAIATAKGLIPETEDAALLTLYHPMTFEILGEKLRLFQGWALRDLVNFRKRLINNTITCIQSFLEVQPPGPSSIWVGCPDVMPPRAWTGWTYQRNRVLPKWLNQLLWSNQNGWKHKNFTGSLRLSKPPGSSSVVRLAYLTALKPHETCSFCSGVDKQHGLTFCTELENKLVEACKKVSHSL